MTAWLRRLLLLVLVLGLVGCDQITKSAAKSELENGPAYALIGSALELRYTENRDVAFNALRAIPDAPRKDLILVAGAGALVGLAVLLLRSRKNSTVTLAALALVFAGALGNYADRLLRGYVVDFVHLNHWPVFNLADVYVTLGALVLVLGECTRRRFNRSSA